jgi:glycosyltransferase involved in cell wall biosynthesis
VKVLLVTNLFPDATEPQRGIYSARMAAHLAQEVEVRVVSPRPTAWPRPGAARQARPEDAALAPLFPRVPYVPWVGSRWNHRLMARALDPVLQRVRTEFAWDVVLTSWLYPDACAVARLAGRPHWPWVAVALGTDVHQYLGMPVRRKIIVESLARAGGVIACSGALAEQLVTAGVSRERLRVVYNGVDTGLFRPVDRAAARRELGWPAEVATVLFVGNLLPVKNPGLLLAACAGLSAALGGRPWRAVFVGDGPLRGGLEAEVRRRGWAGQVVFVGRQPEQAVARHLGAADALCVPSRNEGMPNVIWEALAAGLPVAACRVGGIPEIMREDYLGRLAPAGDAAGLTAALAAVLRGPTEPERIRAYAQQFTWAATARAYREVLETALRGSGVADRGGKAVNADIRR